MDPSTANVVQTAILRGATMGIAAIVIGTRARIRVSQINADGQKQGDKEALAIANALRRDVAGLRDITTGYDMSFDTSLQRLESRMTHIEQSRTSTQEPVVIQSAVNGAAGR